MIFTTKSSSLVLPCDPDDIPALVDIHARSFERGWSESEFDTLLQDKLVNCFVLRHSNARVTDKVIGFVLARSAADEAEILTIAIDPDFRAKGAGRRLMGDLVRKLYGDRVAKLFLEVDADNKAALSLYKALGFVKVGERKAYYRQEDGDASLALIMQLDVKGTRTGHRDRGRENPAQDGT